MRLRVDFQTRRPDTADNKRMSRNRSRVRFAHQRRLPARLSVTLGVFAAHRIPIGSFAISAAVVFVGATVLIACGAFADRGYEFLMIPGFLIAAIALGAWFQAIRR